jgi:glycerol uptake facilitator protein
LIGPGTVIALSLVPGLDPLVALGIIALSFGATVAGVIISLGRYSAHINPAVTVAHVAIGKIDRSRLVPYLSFQIMGGLFAGLTLRLILGSTISAASLGSTKLASSISPTTGIIIETIGTLVLVFVILFTTDNVVGRGRQGLIIGTALFILIVLIGPLTGASFNPARSLGPAIASGYLSDQLVYWIGPLSGGLTGATLFNLVRKNQRGRGDDGKDSLRLC